MGRIKSTMIKRASRQLLAGDNDFTSDFDNNKKLLNNTMPSKSVRNKIAGYIARLKKHSDSQKELTEPVTIAPKE